MLLYSLGKTWTDKQIGHFVVRIIIYWCAFLIGMFASTCGVGRAGINT